MCLQDQYQFCYRAALEYLSSFDHYTDQWQPAGLELGVWRDTVILRIFGQYQSLYLENKGVNHLSYFIGDDICR